MMRVQSQDTLRIACHPIAATLCLVLFLLVGCEAEQSKLAGLAEVATEEESSFVSRAAVEKLTDQAVLAKIAVGENAGQDRRGGKGCGRAPCCRGETH
jgi:hypothetical protein